MNSTLAEILAPYNRAEIARQLGTTRGRVNRWAQGEIAPDVREIPKLAELLRVSVSDLTSIIAKDSKRQTERRASEAVA